MVCTGIYSTVSPLVCRFRKLRFYTIIVFSQYIIIIKNLYILYYGPNMFCLCVFFAGDW